MKKLKLKALNLGANEVLSRTQLKNIFGGSGSGSGGSEGSGGRIPCYATAYCTPNPGGPSVTCNGYNACSARDGHSVTCDTTGWGNPVTTHC